MKKTIKYYINNLPKYLLSLLIRFWAKIGFVLNDKLYLKVLFRLKMGYWMDFDNPMTFNEKLQWLKLYNRKPEYTVMVDKYAVKEYVAERIGAEYIIPTLGVWDRVEDIIWDQLPDQFVLKCTHDSGGLVICRDKSKLNKDEAVKKLKQGLHRSYYKIWREWPYKNVPKRIIAEKYIEVDPGVKDLPDYKFFCFDGDVKAMFVATERQNPNEEVKFDFFDSSFQPLPFRQGHDHAKTLPNKPCYFEKMKEAAAKLSKGIPHVRVDFYEINGGILFGEMTLFHFSGLVPFEPAEWDLHFGDMLNLPDKKQ